VKRHDDADRNRHDHGLNAVFRTSSPSTADRTIAV
jgi:hypothetical protein